jgi:phage terminase small subunit
MSTSHRISENKTLPLTPQQIRFCAEYVRDLNGTQAAIRAGYSRKTAGSQAYDLLKSERIRDGISRASARKLLRMEDENITPDEILRHFSKICRADLRRVFDDQGNMVPIRDWPDGMAGAISAVKITLAKSGDRSTEIKLWDKNVALANMAKHFGLLKDLTEHTGSITYGWMSDDDEDPAAKATH